MEDVKSWMSSKTVWASLLTIVVGVLTSTGLLTTEGGQAILSSGPDFILGIVNVVLGGVALYGRVTAQTVLK